MTGFGYVCALVLAAVFVRAAAAKLARPEHTSAGMAALGLPAATVLARAVPVVELVVAAALVAVPAAGGAAAFVLLGAFTVVLARAVRAGVSTGCTCFGAASNEPVSGTDLLRNLLLAGLAVAAWTAPAPATPTPWAVVAAGAGCLAGLALLLVSLRRSRQLRRSR